MPNPENLEGKGFDERPENINKNGANRGSQWSKKIIRKYFDQEISGKDLDGKEAKIPAGELAIIECIKKAIKGDVKSLKELLDRLEGTPIQTVNQHVVSDTNKPINEWVDTPTTDETKQ